DAPAAAPDLPEPQSVALAVTLDPGHSWPFVVAEQGESLDELIGLELEGRPPFLVLAEQSPFEPWFAPVDRAHEEHARGPFAGEARCHPVRRSCPGERHLVSLVRRSTFGPAHICHAVVEERDNEALSVMDGAIGARAAHGAPQ